MEVEIRSVPRKAEISNLPRILALSEDVEPGHELFGLHVHPGGGDSPRDVELFFRVLEGDPRLFEMRGDLDLFFF